jgi:bifunctional non-homologous end joining protein LigD
MKAQLPQATKIAHPYLNNEHWGMQQKVDGFRMLLACGDSIKTYNRKGDHLDCPQAIIDYFSIFTTHWVFDGELLGEVYYVFDLLEIPTGDIRAWPLSRRYEMLQMLSNKFDNNIVQVLPLFTVDKESAMNTLIESKAEGVVFKRLDAEYIGKKTNSQLKYKFIKQVDCVILDRNINSKDNFLLGMFNGIDFIEVGKCSALTGDGPQATVGSVIQVDILYVTKGNRLYQPVKPKLRFDKEPVECTIDQIDEFKTSKDVLIKM